MACKFLYFDLGKVVVDFDPGLMCRQMGEVAGIGPSRVSELLFEGGLQRQYELGQLSCREFYEVFCEKSGSRPDYDALQSAGSDIFEVNPTILPVVAQLQQAGYRLGILSNTCRSHWEHCLRRYRIVAEGFEVYVLSYEVGLAKPDARIFAAAAESAGVAAEEVFFVDDLPENVAGARAAGIDAVQYASATELAAELRARGIRFNY
jgi:putative hydrolase of the HAD superfamily